MGGDAVRGPAERAGEHDGVAVVRVHPRVGGVRRAPGGEAGGDRAGPAGAQRLGRHRGRGLVVGAHGAGGGVHAVDLVQHAADSPAARAACHPPKG
jgi:hypothetical protein